VDDGPRNCCHHFDTRSTLKQRSGHGFIGGQNDPVDIATAERLACTGHTQTVTLDSAGAPLDVGREHRLYTKQQRTALAVQDGGCRFPDCDRPASCCECHHISFWARDHGRTDLADGTSCKQDRFGMLLKDSAI
jgi:hypothetical protein